MDRKEEILQTFSDINYAYNNCTKYDTLKRMLDELTEPCEDAISRQMVLDTLDNTDKFMDEDRTVETYKALLKECYEVLPSVTPKQKDGHWEWLTEDKYRCSNCNHETRVDECMNKPLYDFCPFCGAKMEVSE